MEKQEQYFVQNQQRYNMNQGQSIKLGQESGYEWNLDLHQYFQFEIESARAKLTYQLLYDLTALKKMITANKQSDPAILEALQKKRKKLLEIYSQKIKQLQDIASKQQTKCISFQILELKDQIQKAKQSSKNNNISSLLESHKQLIKQQKQLINNIQKFIDVVVQRINEQKKLQHQQAMINYILDQKKCFINTKQKFRQIVNKLNQEEKQKTLIVKNTQQAMQKQIQKLKSINNQLHQQRDRLIAHNNQLVSKEKQTYERLHILNVDICQKKYSFNPKLKRESKVQKSFGQEKRSAEQKNYEDLQLRNKVTSKAPSGSTQTESVKCVIQQQQESQIKKTISTLVILFVLSIIVWFV